MKSGFLKLREQDSNLWPLGYEPNELPTAPSRDIFFVENFSIYCFAKVQSI